MADDRATPTMNLRFVKKEKWVDNEWLWVKELQQQWYDGTEYEWRKVEEVSRE